MRRSPSGEIVMETAPPSLLILQKVGALPFASISAELVGAAKRGEGAPSNPNTRAVFRAFIQ
jgi:hypothetical protein